MRLNFEGSENLELRVCLSLITSTPLEINNIGVREAGLKPEQISFLELLSKISNGAIFDINKTGCRLRVTPGTLLGGVIEHDCHHGEALGYYGLYLVLLAPFCQRPIEATLRGVTNKANCLSPERLTFGLNEVVKEMVGEAGIFSFEVKHRGAFPDGGGMALFIARPVRSLMPLNRTKVGKIQKIKGLAWTTRLNVTLGKRVIDGAKQNFKGLLSDFYVRLDHSSKDKSGNSPGFGMILHALTTDGNAYTTEVSSKSKAEFDGEQSIPEDMGSEATYVMKKAIARGGVISSEHEPIVLTMMALGKQNVSKVLIGVPGCETCQTLKDLVLFTGVKFNVVPIRSGMDLYREYTQQELLLTCMGCGMVNLNRAIK